MMLCRVFFLTAMLAGLTLPANAQFGGMPGMPGSEGMPGMPGTGGPGPGFSQPQAAPPPACQQLLATRDDVQKHGQAIEAANKRHATAAEACKLFRAFLTMEAKLVKGLEDSQQTCGVPPEAVKQAKAGHVKASEIGKQVCDAAAQGGGAGPSLSDALGATLTIPDASNTKTGQGGGTYDTLSGNPLAR